MRTVSVVGHGTVVAVPDTALVRIAAVVRAATMAAALAGAEEARAAALTTAGDLVVSTVDLSVWPAHDQQGVQVGFEARHALVVACPSVGVAGDLLTRLAEAVGDRLQVEGVTLAVSDPTPYAVTARAAAWSDARASAEQLAGLAGCVLGDVQQIIEGGAAAPAIGREMAYAAKSDVSLSPGETSIGATVAATWELSASR